MNITIESVKRMASVNRISFKYKKADGLSYGVALTPEQIVETYENESNECAAKDEALRLAYERVARLESIMQAVIRGEYNNAREINAVEKFARESWQEYLTALAKATA